MATVAHLITAYRLAHLSLPPAQEKQVGALLAALWPAELQQAVDTWVEASVHHKTAILKLRAAASVVHLMRNIGCACAVMQLKGHFWLLYMLLHTL